VTRERLVKRIERLEAASGGTACTLEGLIAESFRELACDDVDAEDVVEHLARCRLCAMILGPLQGLGSSAKIRA